MNPTGRLLCALGIAALCLLSHVPFASAEEPLRVILIGAHPDDSEYAGGGTAALWADAGAEERMVTKWGGFLEHFDEFDASFFGITPREAIRLDPVRVEAWVNRGSARSDLGEYDDAIPNSGHRRLHVPPVPSAGSRSRTRVERLNPCTCPRRNR